MRLLRLVLQNKQGIQEDDTQLRIRLKTKDIEIAVLSVAPGKLVLGGVS